MPRRSIAVWPIGFLLKHLSALLQRLLSEVVADNSSVKDDEAAQVIKAVAENKASRSFIWNWFKSNWKKVNSKYPEDLPSPMQRIIPAITESFGSESEISELVGFSELPDLGQLRKPIQKAILETKSNILWLESHLQEIVDWLKSKNSNPPRIWKLQAKTSP